METDSISLWQKNYNSSLHAPHKTFSHLQQSDLRLFVRIMHVNTLLWVCSVQPQIDHQIILRKVKIKKYFCLQQRFLDIPVKNCIVGMMLTCPIYVACYCYEHLPGRTPIWKAVTTFFTQLKLNCWNCYPVIPRDNGHIYIVTPLEPKQAQGNSIKIWSSSLPIKWRRKRIDQSFSNVLRCLLAYRLWKCSIDSGDICISSLYVHVYLNRLVLH